MSPEQRLRLYFHANDENRPHLLEGVFASDARLEIASRSARISFPAVVVGLEGIADVLVRRFNARYENVYSFYRDRPSASAQTFACDWRVGTTEKASRGVRIGCGSCGWAIRRDRVLLASKLVITIEHMVVLATSHAGDVMRSLLGMDHPWSSAGQVTRAPPMEELGPARRYLGRMTGG